MAYGQTADEVKVDTKIDPNKQAADDKANTDNDGNTNNDTKLDPTDWRSGISDEYKTSIGEDIKDLNGLAKQYVEQQKFLGNSIRIPSEDAGDDANKEFQEKIAKHAPNLISRPDPTDEVATKEFWKMAGVPDEAKDYKLVESPEDMSEEWVDNTKTLAHRYGLTNKGFEQYVKDQYEVQKGQVEANDKAQDDSLKAIHTEWGQATEGKIADINKFATEMGFPEDFTEAIKESQVSGVWLKALDGIIQQFGGMKEGAEAAFQRGANVPDTPNEIEMKIVDIEGNAGFRNPNDPKHSILVEKRMKLIQDLQKSRAK